MKILFLIILSCATLFSTTINTSLLKIHATLLPKIYLMQYDLNNKIKDNTIRLTILYNQSTYKDAKTLKYMIEHKYNKHIKKYKLAVNILMYNSKKHINTNVYYLLPSSKKDIKDAVKLAKEDNALTFSYLKDDLKDGVMCSLSVAKKIKPILNLKAIKDNDISFRPILIKISSIYHHTYTNLISKLNEFLV